MKQAKRRWGIDFNSPVILGMTVICLALVIIDSLSGGALNMRLAVYYTSFRDPGMYVRLFSHVLAHADMSHYTSNFLLILAVGPMVEEKYGSGRLLLMVLITALVTGLINVLFFRGTALLGASGIVFMLILLASFTNIQQGKLPLTVLLVGIIYIGNEIAAGLTIDDNVSRISHIVGGLCGACFGWFFNSHRLSGKDLEA